MNVVHVATRMQTAHSFVSARLGVAFSPIHARGIHVDGTVRVPLDPYPSILTLDLAAFRDRVNRKKSLKIFLNIARNI